MKIVYFGHGDYGAACLAHILQAGRGVAHVFTHPDGGNVEAAAKKYSVPVTVLAAKETDRAAEVLKNIAPDLIVSVTWRGLFSKKILEIPKRGAINLHGSLLPRWRGNAPVTWAILSGDTETGATVHFIDEGMDTGDIIAQVKTPIHETDTVGDVLGRLLKLDGPLLEEALKKLEDKSFKLVPQDHAKATVGKKRAPEDGVIDWSQPAKKIYDWVRAQTKPLPGAFTYAGGSKVTIWRASIADEATGGRPGTIRKAEENNVIVHTNHGLIRIEEAESMAGGKPIFLADLIKNGIVAEGKILGA